MAPSPLGQAVRLEPELSRGKGLAASFSPGPSGQAPSEKPTWGKLSKTKTDLGAAREYGNDQQC